MPPRHDALPVGPGSTFEFIVLYAVLAAMVLAVANFAAVIVLAWFERTARALGPTTRRGSSRSDDLDHRRYAIGFVPLEEEILGLAYLRGGAPKVAETIRATAIAAGWLVHAEGQRWILKRLPRGAPPWATTLTRPLSVGTITDAALEQAATATAKQLEPSLVADLESVGFLRSNAARGAGGLTIVALSAWVVVIGAVRTLDGRALGEPVWLLAGEVAAVALTMLGLAANIGRRTAAAEAWLAWLDKATAALRRRVARERAGRARADDAALAAALG
ncbi:MAG: hypothetical protein U0414_39250 [Polyangiaceae bacterium]